MKKEGQVLWREHYIVFILIKNKIKCCAMTIMLMMMTEFLMVIYRDSHFLKHILKHIKKGFIIGTLLMLGKV